MAEAQEQEKPWLTYDCQTMVNVIDNSGAAVAECVKVLKMKRAAKIGTFPSAQSSSPAGILPPPSGPPTSSLTHD